VVTGLPSGPGAFEVESFLVATGLVALAEIGDKTQLLAFVLAARFRKAAPVVLGILVATLANHTFAAGLGVWIAALLPPEALRWLLGLSFIAMAAWVLVPDGLEEEKPRLTRLGMFGTTVVVFFLAEMGDKTQVATVALAATYGSLVVVVAGTTLGMMIANAPAVYLGERCARRVSIPLVHAAAALVFALLGVLVLLGAGRAFGF
jgi:Ca2+/H+ antiporter, TMEM165/GDT1 family